MVPLFVHSYITNTPDINDTGCYLKIIKRHCNL